MGLLDILNGMQNGPRGAPVPSSDQSGKSGGMSPLTMAILGLLAWKAMKHFGGSGQPAGPGGGNRANNLDADQAGGGIGDLLGGLLGNRGGAPGGGLGNLGGLGGLLAGGAAGGILSGGLNDLLKQFQENGQGEAANSWVGSGPNREISPNDLANALGSDQINALTAQTGMSREELLSGLSDQLPEVINQLTPDGRVPTEDEASRWV